MFTKFIIALITAVEAMFLGFAAHHYFGDPFGAIALIISLLGGAYFLATVEAKFFD